MFKSAQVSVAIKLGSDANEEIIIKILLGTSLDANAGIERSSGNWRIKAAIGPLSLSSQT